MRTFNSRCIFFSFQMMESGRKRVTRPNRTTRPKRCRPWRTGRCRCRRRCHRRCRRRCLRYRRRAPVAGAPTCPSGCTATGAARRRRRRRRPRSAPRNPKRSATSPTRYDPFSSSSCFPLAGGDVIFRTRPLLAHQFEMTSTARRP